MTELPRGTVTFQFTDIAGSTRLWEEHPDAMQPALAQHDEILDAAITAHDGHVVKTTGDGSTRCSRPRTTHSPPPSRHKPGSAATDSDRSTARRGEGPMPPGPR